MDMLISKLSRLLTEHTTQLIVFISLTVIVFILTGVAQSLDGTAFQKYFGRLQPLLAVAIVFVIGLLLFAFLLDDGQFAIYKSGNTRGILLAIALALPFGAVVILVDRLAPFPADINVPFPASAFFYPAIAYVVEIIFHILPFTLLYFALGFFLRGSSSERIIWFSILLVALLEPVFQVVFTSGQQSYWVSIYLVVNLFLFNLVQLLLFVRYDFVSMYAFRISYYIIWHIIWGHLRLGLLF